MIRKQKTIEQIRVSNKYNRKIVETVTTKLKLIHARRAYTPFTFNMKTDENLITDYRM